MNIQVLIILLFTSSITLSQQLVSEIGRVSSTFDYSNSDGEALDNLYSSSDFSYFVGYRLTLAERIFLNGGLVFNKYNNEGSDLVYDNFYSWKTTYLGLAIGGEYEFFNYKKFRFLAKANLEPQFLVKGTQTINSQVFSLKGVEQFDKPFLFMRGGIGANYCLDNKVALTLRYMLGAGNPLGKSSDGETLKLKTNTFSIGLLWSIKGCKYCQNKR